jgi:hypothetical protein
MGAGYRPPRQPVAVVDHFMSLLQDRIDKVLKRKPESIILFGDFNDVCTDWEDEHIRSDLGVKLYDLVNMNDFHQMVREPTHISTYYANILDILIMDSPGYITKQAMLPPLGSNHQIVNAHFKIQYKRDKAYLRENGTIKRVTMKVSIES